DTVARCLPRTALVRGLPAVARTRMAARTIRRGGSGFWPGAQNKARGVVPPGRRARENQPMPRTASRGLARKPPSAAFDWQFSFRLIGRSKLSKSKLATLGYRYCTAFNLTDARVSQRQ